MKFLFGLIVGLFIGGSLENAAMHQQQPGVDWSVASHSHRLDVLERTCGAFMNGVIGHADQAR